MQDLLQACSIAAQTPTVPMAGIIPHLSRLCLAAIDLVSGVLPTAGPAFAFDCFSGSAAAGACDCGWDAVMLVISLVYWAAVMRPYSSAPAARVNQNTFSSCTNESGAAVHQDLAYLLAV